MIFEVDHLYHIYNQGNNRQKIFFLKDNYHFFVKKIEEHFLPYSDILAWCLMPNHFHVMVYVKKLECPAIQGFTLSETLNAGYTIRSFNDSIGIMLRSYTRAINKQENRTGSLFRSTTKAICLNCSNGLSPNYFNTPSGTLINVHSSEKQYPQSCFEYIHDNPVKANLVKKPEDWEFSSYNEYFKSAGINARLINKIKAADFGLV
jgi:putative transposase